MTKIFKWLNVIFMVLVLIELIGCTKQDETSSNQITESAKYVLNEKETKVFNIMLQNDVDGFLSGEDSMLAKEFNLIVANAEQVAQAYEDNEVAADQKYYEKGVLLNGKVRSINSGLRNEPYIVLDGRESYLDPQIQFDNPNIETIASLSKGQELSFICKGGGAIVGTPIFKHCQFADEFASNVIEEIRIEAQKFLNGEVPKVDTAGKLTFIAIVGTRLLPKKSKCYSGGKDCVTEIQKAFNNASEEKVYKISGELKQLGLKV